MIGFEQRLLQQFVAAFKAVNLYPAQHPSRKNPRNAAFTTICEFFEQFGHCEIAIRDDVLTINDEPLFEETAAGDDLFRRFGDLDITTVRFSQGLIEEELGIFLEVIAKDEDGFGHVDQLDKLLATAGVKHVEIEKEDDDDIAGKAIKTYTAATGYMKGLWAEARLGKIPAGGEAVSLIDDMSEILAQDRAPIVGLTMLSDYDNYTFNHSVNVGVFAMALAEEYGYSQKDAKVVGLGGLLHDVGKTRVPIEVINKPGRLVGDEWTQMQRHPEYSGELVQQMELSYIFDIVQQHHVGWNRAGYPKIPDTKELAEGGLMTAVVDVYDSMTTTRPYQRCHTPQEALTVLFKLKGNGHLHPDMVDAFTRTLGIYPVGTCVRLQNGCVGFVNSVYKGEDQRPIIKLIRDAAGAFLPEPELIDLREEKQYDIVGTLDPSIYGLKPADYVDPAPAFGGG